MDKKEEIYPLYCKIMDKIFIYWCDKKREVIVNRFPLVEFFWKKFSRAESCAEDVNLLIQTICIEQEVKYANS